MTKRELLLDKIKEHNGIITTKEALELGVHKDILKELTLKHEIVKIANGLYGLPNEEIDEYIYFSYRVPKGVFSHETAAYLQGLSTRMPIFYVMTVPVGDNVSRVKEKTVLDLIKDKYRVDTGVFSEVMKLYFDSDDKDLLKLSKYAISMNMEEQLKIYTEILL